VGVEDAELDFSGWERLVDLAIFSIGHHLVPVTAIGDPRRFQINLQFEFALEDVAISNVNEVLRLAAFFVVVFSRLFKKKDEVISARRGKKLFVVDCDDFGEVVLRRHDVEPCIDDIFVEIAHTGGVHLFINFQEILKAAEPEFAGGDDFANCFEGIDDESCFLDCSDETILVDGVVAR
jgi:hypothetical protein